MHKSCLILMVRLGCAPAPGSGSGAGSGPCLGCCRGQCLAGKSRGHPIPGVPCLQSSPGSSASPVPASGPARHLEGAGVFSERPLCFFFFLPALPPLQLSHPGCQFKSFLNRSRRVCRVSAPSVIYTVLPGPLCSITEK